LSPESKKRKKAMAAIEERNKRLDKLLKSSNEKKRGGEVNDEYIDASFILGTNDIVERFFSTSKNILSEERSKLTPYMFECLVYLKANRHFWGQQEVAEAMRKQDSNANETADYDEWRELMEREDSLEV
jgi:hypothetical protein